jgi:alpha-beta hydrolase superfamily lysophospholipase
MPIEEGFFEARDRTKLFYRFQPGSLGKNPLVLLHGHGDHSGRYLKFFSRLADLELPIGIFDYRGCGRSEGPRVYVSRLEDYLEDLTEFIQHLKTRYGTKLPCQVFGHSLGGLVAAAWAYHYQDRVETSKLILSSPLFGIRLGVFLRMFVEVANRWFPKFVYDNPVHPPFLTHDQGEVERYRQDDLIQRKITARLAHEMLRFGEFFQKTRVSFRMPVYLLMAEKDFVVDPRAAFRFYDRLEAPRKELEVFYGFFHDTFNEIGQDEYFARLRYYLTL